MEMGTRRAHHQEIPVYRPTPDEWRMGLAAYVERVVEPSGGAAVGLCKVIPPNDCTWSQPEHQRRLEALACGTAATRDAAVVVPTHIQPIRQHTSGMRGRYRLDIVDAKKQPIADFRDKARQAMDRTAERVRESIEQLASCSGRPYATARDALTGPGYGGKQPPGAGTGTGEGKSESQRQQEPPVVSWRPGEEEALADVERAFWRSLGSVKAPAEYGGDQEGTLFGSERLDGWGVNNLESILSLGVHDGATGVRGVTTPMLYIGMWRALFGWHVEDVDLASVNYLHFGKPKVWYVVPPHEAKRLEAVARATFGAEALKCREFLRHKIVLLSPSVLRDAGVTVLHGVQYSGEFMLTFPRAYHAGFNTGWNCAESCNFATPRWLPVGRRAWWCDCEATTVRLNVDELAEVVREKFPRRLHAVPVAGDRVMARWRKQEGWRLVRLVEGVRKGGLEAVPVTLASADLTRARVTSDAHGRESAATPIRTFDLQDPTLEWRWPTKKDRAAPLPGDTICMKWSGFDREFMVRVLRAKGSRGGSRRTSGQKAKRVALSVVSATGLNFGEWAFDPLHDQWYRPTEAEIRTAKHADVEAASRVARKSRKRPRARSTRQAPRTTRRPRKSATQIATCEPTS